MDGWVDGWVDGWMEHRETSVCRIKYKRMKKG
jgi:hypothetical protein